MQVLQRHPLLTSVVALALVLTIVIAGYGVFLASEAGKLPWQVDPTRIPVTPFSDFPGFGSPSTPVPTPGGP
jgi:hypothetical protein